MNQNLAQYSNTTMVPLVVTLTSTTESPWTQNFSTSTQLPPSKSSLSLNNFDSSFDSVPFLDDSHTSLQRTKRFAPLPFLFGSLGYKAVKGVARRNKEVACSNFLSNLIKPLFTTMMFIFITMVIPYTIGIAIYKLLAKHGQVQIVTEIGKIYLKQMKLLFTK